LIPQGYKQYQRTQTETASPGELIVLLYGGAIKFLTVARQRLDAGDLEASHRSLLRAQEIILELMISVDVSVGPVAQSLFDLYEFMHRRLVEANVKKDGQLIDDVVGLLRELLPSWEQAIAASQKSPAAPVAIRAVA
jgi:flagellar protein FliS